MQIPIISGIYTDNNADFRTSYPVNMIPVPKQNGISTGYLRPAYGIIEFGIGPGVDRGGINWNGVCYRVMGTKLCRIDSDGIHTEIGDIGGSNLVTMTYSFDYLAVTSNDNLFLYNGTTLQQVTDVDLGTALDVIWIDGYFMSTDGEYLVVSELGDPFTINPLKYGSSEINPDDVVALKKIRNEVYAVNRYSIEVFDNIGGAGFPFQRIDGAQIDRGTIGTKTCAEYMSAIAFLGNSLDESPAIWLGKNGGSQKISTQDIDILIQEYDESTLSQCLMEVASDKSHYLLLLHLPDYTLVYDGNSSSVLGSPVWFILSSALVGKSRYKAQNFVYCYDKWMCGDPTSNNHGYLTKEVSSQYGEEIGWQFQTGIVYNESMGAIFHEIELVSLTGRYKLGDNPTVWTSWSEDGLSSSQEFPLLVGTIGERNNRLSWLRQGLMKNWRSQKFRGTSSAHMSVSRLEAKIEPLYD